MNNKITIYDIFISVLAVILLISSSVNLFINLSLVLVEINYIGILIDIIFLFISLVILKPKIKKFEGSGFLKAVFWTMFFFLCLDVIIFLFDKVSIEEDGVIGLMLGQVLISFVLVSIIRKLRIKNKV